MARSLTGSTTTEKDSNATTPINILKIEYSGAIGTKYYSDRDLSTPVTAEGRVISWGNFSLEAIEQAGRISSITIKLEDTDLVLLGYMRTQDIQELDVYLYQWFSGLSWGTDEVLLLQGVLRNPKWSEDPPSLEIEIDNIQRQWEQKIGTEATSLIFSSIRREHEGKILPLVFGQVERGEAVQVIDARRTTLTLPISYNSTVAIVKDSRDFSQGSGNLYNVFIGMELVRGYFDGSKFQLVDRGKTVATGYTTYAAPNLLTFRATLIPAGPSWIGYRIKFWLGSTIVDRQITNYTSPDVYGIDAWAQIPARTYFEIYGAEVNHDAGEIIREDIDNYTWIINDSPSTSVERVEILASLIIQGAGTSNKLKNINTWIALDERYYTVDLNDSTWSGTLGHNVTSIVMPFDPKVLPNTPYAGDIKPTLTGINTTNPVAIIKDLAQRLGMTYPTDFDTTSESAVQTLTGWLHLGFGVIAKKGFAVLYEIAFQSRISLAFEEGKLYFRYLENKTGASAATIDNTERESDSIRISQQESEEIINRLYYEWFEKGERVRAISEDANSIAIFGEKEKTIVLWAHNNRAYAAAIATFWLRRWANATEIAQIRTFLTSLELQRYDWITLNDGTFYSSQLVEVVKITQAPGSTANIDSFDITARVPKFAGCSSSCELYEETGCASTCEQCCQTLAETACGYACETAAQDACSLTCVSTCEMECTTYAQMAEGCQATCQTSCTNRCETGCTASGCQGGCTSGCTQGCQLDACETACQVACEGGTCQLACESASQTTCAIDCEMAVQQCSGGTCETSCQGACTSGCQSGCQTGGCETAGCQAAACETTGCESVSCTGACEVLCMTTCQLHCEVGACQSDCTTDLQRSGCAYFCTANCETNCQAQCENRCQDACQADGTETTYECTTVCQTACVQNCETTNQAGYIHECATSCVTYCMTAPETGCGTYCTVGCECYCQSSCEAACMTGSCQTACECECQTTVQSTGCSVGTEGACYSTCQVYEETGCATACQTGCQGYCMTGGCEAGCEIYCTTGCQCNCQITCEASCRTAACESSCTCDCQTSAQFDGPCAGCQGYCMIAGQLYSRCITQCESICTTTCRDYCETACTTASCQTQCQGFCQTGGCETGCEEYCTVGCQCECQSVCEAACRSGGCEQNCQCLCQTSAQ